MSKGELAVVGRRCAPPKVHVTRNGTRDEVRGIARPFLHAFGDELCFVIMVLSFLVAIQPTTGIAQQFYPTNVTADAVVAMESAMREKLIADYEGHTNRWSAVDLLPIGIAYAMEGEPRKSERAYLTYLKARPKDGRANRGLGFVYLSEKSYSKATKHFETAWRSGDKRSLLPLADTYIAAGKEPKIRGLLPDLFNSRTEAKGEERLEVSKVIAYYAINSKPFQRDVFLKGIEGLADGEILGDKGAVGLIIEGLDLAGDKTRASTLREKSQQETK